MRRPEVFQRFAGYRNRGHSEQPRFAYWPFSDGTGTPPMATAVEHSVHMCTSWKQHVSHE